MLPYALPAWRWCWRRRFQCCAEKWGARILRPLMFVISSKLLGVVRRPNRAPFELYFMGTTLIPRNIFSKVLLIERWSEQMAGIPPQLQLLLKISNWLFALRVGWCCIGTGSNFPLCFMTEKRLPYFWDWVVEGTWLEPCVPESGKMRPELLPLRYAKGALNPGQIRKESSGRLASEVSGFHFILFYLLT